MYLCDNDHEEVCYSCNDCPVCMAKETIDQLKRDIETLKEELKDAKR